jgi:hypothetical protein
VLNMAAEIRKCNRHATPKERSIARKQFSILHSQTNTQDPLERDEQNCMNSKNPTPQDSLYLGQEENLQNHFVFSIKFVRSNELFPNL